MARMSDGTGLDRAEIARRIQGLRSSLRHSRDPRTRCTGEEIHVTDRPGYVGSLRFKGEPAGCATCRDLGFIFKHSDTYHPDYGHAIPMGRKLPCPECEFGREREERAKASRRMRDDRNPSDFRHVTD